LQVDSSRILAAARAAVDRADYRAALDYYQQHLRLNPLHAEGYYELAWILRQVDEPLHALSQYQRALDLGIKNPHEVHLNRSVIYADELQDYGPAERELRQALRLQPNYFAAWLNLGNLMEDTAQREPALRHYQRTVDLARRDDPFALQAQARILHLLGAAASEQDVQNALDLSKSAKEPSLAASLCFAAAHVCHAKAQFDTAFALFQRAQTTNQGAAAPYDFEKHTAFCDAIIADLAVVSQQKVHVEPKSPAPLFVVGMFRSGSTLIEQVLNAHPAIKAYGEINFLPRVAARLLQPYPAAMQALTKQTLEAWRAYYLARFSRVPMPEGIRYCTDKRPDNFLLLGLIKRLFPQAKIIWTARAPLDNALSIFQQQLDPQIASYASTLSGIAHHYAQQLRVLEAARTLFPEDLFVVNYDAFVRDPVVTLRSLLQFLDLPWDERCLSFHEQTNSVKTASLWQVRQALNARSSGRWCCYATQLEPLIAAFQQNGVALDLSATQGTDAG
jgi:tetratricopeptide (TPR) repeat protein